MTNPTEQGNKLLAEYMGFTFLSDGSVNVKSDVPAYLSNWSRMMFDARWDWLFPVLSKLTQHKWEDGDTAYLRTFGERNEETGQAMVRFNRCPLFQADLLIDAAWMACVDFVTHIASAPPPQAGADDAEEVPRIVSNPTELLPCPFCGGKAVLNPDGSHDGIVCSTPCFASMRYGYRSFTDHLIRDWNTRPPAAPEAKPEDHPVVDIMAALKASIAKAKEGVKATPPAGEAESEAQEFLIRLHDEGMWTEPMNEEQLYAVSKELAKFAHAHAAKAVEAERQRLARLVDAEIEVHYITEQDDHLPVQQVDKLKYCNYVLLKVKSWLAGEGENA